MTYFCNMNLFDEKGRRVAIFGTKYLFKSGKTPIYHLRTYVYTCSKADQFSRKIAQKAFNVGSNEYHPLIEDTSIEYSRSNFNHYCHNNYYRLQEFVIPTSHQLIDSNSLTLIRPRKWSLEKGIKYKAFVK